MYPALKRVSTCYETGNGKSTGTFNDNFFSDDNVKKSSATVTMFFFANKRNASIYYILHIATNVSVDFFLLARSSTIIIAMDFTVVPTCCELPVNITAF